MVIIIWVPIDTLTRKKLLGVGIMLMATIEWGIPYLKRKLRERRIKKISLKNWEIKHHIGEKTDISESVYKQDYPKREWLKKIEEIAQEEATGSAFFP